MSTESPNHPDHDLPAGLAPMLDDYIKELQALHDAHGNLPVEKWMPAKGRHGAPAPRLAHRRVWPRGQEKAPAFWNEHDTEAQRGEAVIRI